MNLANTNVSQSLSTHIKGCTLLLTNCENILSDLQVLPDDHICTSDHFPLTFKIKTSVVHKPSTKRTVLNFNKADCGALTQDNVYSFY